MSDHEHHDHLHEHTHTDAEGHVYTHSHGGGSEGHPHMHSHTQTKAVLNRLSRAIGHLESVKQMVLDGRDCSEVLIQLSAVRSALNKAGMQIIQSHIEHCLVDAVQRGDTEAVKELNQAIALYLK